MWCSMATRFRRIMSMLWGMEVRLSVYLMISYKGRKIRLAYHLVEVKYLGYSTQTYETAWIIACHSSPITLCLIRI